jgi:hypothetical protein
MENLYDYYFHFNHYTGEWNAFLRSESNLYMSGVKPNFEYAIFTNTDINKLIDKISELQTSEIL